MQDQPDRRQFLRTTARWSVLGAMGAGAGVLGARTVRRDGPCINRSICRGCAISGRCGLPQALSFRQATQER